VTLLSVAALDRVVEHAREDLTVTVEAGIRARELASRLREAGQWIPVLEGAAGTVGGVVACDRRGILAGSLGSAGDALLGMSFVDARGEVVRGGGRVVKNVAGYDLMRLATGSLGALGALVEVTLRIRTRPAAWGAVERPVEAAAEVLQVLQEGPAWDPLALLRFDLGEGERVLALFAGSAARVEAQVHAARNRWGSDARVLSPSEAEELPSRFAARFHPGPNAVAWGGALPSHLSGNGTGAALEGGAWWADLLRGHLGWVPDGREEEARLPAIRDWARKGEGHLHLDRPSGVAGNGMAWGRESGEEERSWRRLREAVDPDRVWAYGRLPGEEAG
jgi:FAD/FMN-containing dehydrogenase